MRGCLGKTKIKAEGSVGKKKVGGNYFNHFLQTHQLLGLAEMMPFIYSSLADAVAGVIPTGFL